MMTRTALTRVFKRKEKLRRNHRGQTQGEVLCRVTVKPGVFRAWFPPVLPLGMRQRTGGTS